MQHHPLLNLKKRKIWLRNELRERYDLNLFVVLCCALMQRASVWLMSAWRICKDSLNSVVQLLGGGKDFLDFLLGWGRRGYGWNWKHSDWVLMYQWIGPLFSTSEPQFEPHFFTFLLLQWRVPFLLSIYFVDCHPTEYECRTKNTIVSFF